MWRPAISLLNISLLVSACASPTAPDRSVQSVSGGWQGHWRITHCDMSRGCECWSHDGIICTGETYKAVVKLTFAKGVSLRGRS